MTIDKPQPRRWFQFRLRTLLIVTAVVALACPWLAAKYHEYRQEQELQEMLRTLVVDAVS